MGFQVVDDGGSFGLWAFWLCLDPECCGRARILAMQSGGQLWGLEAGAAAARLGSRRQKNVIVEPDAWAVKAGRTKKKRCRASGHRLDASLAKGFPEKTKI